MIRAVLFDVFGTVVDWRSGVARDARAFFQRRGLTQIDPHEFADAWRRRYQPAMEEIRDGRRPFVRLDVLHRENLEHALRAYEIDPNGIAGGELDDLNLAWHRLDPWPDSIAGLARLKTKYIVASQSNGNISLMIDMAKRAGMPWDAILGAEVAQAYKPSPQAYERVAEVLGMRPDEVCLAAAHNDDLAAARGCGWRTAFVPRPTEHGPGQATDLHPAEDWDVIAEDMLDLAGKLGA